MTLDLRLACTTAALLLAAGCGGPPSAQGAPNLLPGETVVDDGKDPDAGKRRGETPVAGADNDIVLKQMQQGREGGKPTK